ncbi:hypothetical protein ACHAPT_012976 [Fusarium lateritium]
MITIICILWQKSQRNNGLVAVPDNDNASFDSDGFHSAPILSSSIVWATVPAWIISAYSSLWSAMLDALKKLQPTLELDKPNPTRRSRALVWGAWKQRLWSVFGRKPSSPPSPKTPARSTAKSTLLLDYGEWPVLNGIKAIRQGHVLLGIGMLLRVALWTASGLSAAIFAVAQVPRETDVGLYSDKFFDQWLGWDYNKGENFSSATPALEMVSATVVRGGQNYSWTTDTHSFLPYFPASKTGPGNYTFDTEAYWATAECSVATEEDLARAGAVQFDIYDDKYNSAQVRIAYNSQGCIIKKKLDIYNTTLKYGKSWSVIDCPLAAGRMRLGMFTGVYNATGRFHLSNFTVVTCKPTIYRSNVTLEVSIPGDPAAAQVLNFTEKSKEQFWPGFARTWIREIPQYSIFDPTFYLDMDSFSRLVIGHGLKEPTLETLPNKTQLASSFKTVFQALFSNYVTLQAYYPAPKVETRGKLSRLQFRLFVVTSPAFAVVGILATVFCVTLILAVHLHENRASLEKYLDLMLGNALLFRRGAGLEPFLQELEDRALHTQKPPETIDLVKFAEKEKDLAKWSVWMDGTTEALYAEPPPTPVLPAGGGSHSSSTPAGASTAQNTLIPMHTLPRPGPAKTNAQP